MHFKVVTVVGDAPETHQSQRVPFLPLTSWPVLLLNGECCLLGHTAQTPRQKVEGLRKVS